MNSWRPSWSRASSKETASAEYFCRVINLAMGMPASRSRRFITSLSMPTADPRTPAPTNGILASFSNPWTVPSSPKGPWRIGNTTSNEPGAGWPEGRTSCFSCLPGTSAKFSPPGDNCGVSDSADPRRNRDPSSRCQPPFLSIPIRTTSYFSLSMASTMFRADCKETSCSADLPPNNIPTRILDI